MVQVGQGNRMSARAEHTLVARAQGGDPAARERLVGAFMPSIGGIAHRYRSSPGIARTELMQEGVVGLLRALERYEPGRGTPFWAYASWWVRQAMQGVVAELTRPVVLSDRALRQLARLKDAQRAFVQAESREPSQSELAAATGLSRTQVDHLLGVDRTPRGLGEPLAADDGGGSTLGELIADPRADEDYDRVFRRDDVEQLRRLPDRLTDRERRIVCARFGVGCREHTLQEIGTMLGLSAERVRQLEQRALDKLRAAAAEPPQPRRARRPAPRRRGRSGRFSRSPVQAA
jgi:RNA polymerase primary sigma factor